MTYCLAIKLQEGLVLLSDTRTNAGIDNISKFNKTFLWTKPGERAIALLTAGNLSTTQEVVARIDESLSNPVEGVETIFTAPSMFRAAEHIGFLLENVGKARAAQFANAGVNGAASILVCGQIAGEAPRVFQVYSAGNFIEATDDTPFMQIGEFKYGKPVLDRVIRPDTPLDAGIKAALLSMDATLRSNLSVGLPIDLTCLRTDAFDFEDTLRIEQDNPRFQAISAHWSQALLNAFDTMPPIKD